MDISKLSLDDNRYLSTHNDIVEIVATKTSPYDLASTPRWVSIIFVEVENPINPADLSQPATRHFNKCYVSENFDEPINADGASNILAGLMNAVIAAAQIFKLAPNNLAMSFQRVVDQYAARMDINDDKLG